VFFKLRCPRNFIAYKIRRFTVAHLQGLVDVVTFYGDLLAERVRRGTLKPKKIMEVRKKVYQQTKTHFQRPRGMGRGESLNG
jgi:hypothetical protein